MRYPTRKARGLLLLFWQMQAMFWCLRYCREIEKQPIPTQKMLSQL